MWTKSESPNLVQNSKASMLQEQAIPILSQQNQTTKSNNERTFRSVVDHEQSGQDS